MEAVQGIVKFCSSTDSLIKVEGLKIKLELSASDANVSILSHDSGQPIIANPPVGGGVFKQVKCRDLTSV